MPVLTGLDHSRSEDFADCTQTLRAKSAHGMHVVFVKRNGWCQVTVHAAMFV